MRMGQIDIGRLGSLGQDPLAYAAIDRCQEEDGMGILHKVYEPLELVDAP